MRTSNKSFVSITLLAIVFACGFISLVRAQSGEVTLSPAADTYVDSLNPDSNYGGKPYLQIDYWEVYTHNYEGIVWLKFNLSSVPDGAVVDTSSLQLYAYVVGETFDVHVYSSSDHTWSELTLTYSNMPSYITTSMDSVLVATDFQWYSWNVVDAVKEAIRGNPKIVTIVLREPSIHSSAQSVWFDSKEAPVYSENEYTPKLAVHWSVVPEFPSLLFLSLTLVGAIFAVLVHRKLARAD